MLGHGTCAIASPAGHAMVRHRPAPRDYLAGCTRTTLIARNMGANPSVRPIAPVAFEAIADAIMYRWSVERDVWVSPSEVEQARLYLARVGVATLALPDGCYAIDGDRAGVCGAARLVFLGRRHLHATRRTASQD